MVNWQNPDEVDTFLLEALKEGPQEYFATTRLIAAELADPSTDEATFEMIRDAILASIKRLIDREQIEVTICLVPVAPRQDPAAPIPANAATRCTLAWSLRHN